MIWLIWITAAIKMTASRVMMAMVVPGRIGAAAYSERAETSPEGGLSQKGHSNFRRRGGLGGFPLTTSDVNVPLVVGCDGRRRGPSIEHQRCSTSRISARQVRT